MWQPFQLQILSRLFSVCSKCTRMSQYLHTHSIQNINSYEFAPGIAITYLQYHNIVTSCLSVLCVLEFYYFDHPSAGDAVPRLSCWTCVPLIWETRWEWQPGVHTRRRLIFAINVILVSAFFVGTYLQTNKQTHRYNTYIHYIHI